MSPLGIYPVPSLTFSYNPTVTVAGGPRNSPQSKHGGAHLCAELCRVCYFQHGAKQFPECVSFGGVMALGLSEFPCFRFLCQH